MAKNIFYKTNKTEQEDNYQQNLVEESEMCSHVFNSSLLCSPSRACSPCRRKRYEVENVEPPDTDFEIPEQYYEEDEQDEEEEHEIMSDTFFKRVESVDMQKPRCAKIVKNYLIGEILGDGSYGKVKECLDLNSLCRRAVKIINFKTVARKIPHGVENVRKEINIMHRLNNKNVIKLYDTFEKNSVDKQSKDQIINADKPPKLYIFMDYCMTSLERLLKNAPEQRLRNWQAQHYFKQLIDGLEYLHSISIIHNDIKPGNLLIACDDMLKICDFSISAELSLFHEFEYTLLKKEEESNLDNELKPNLLTNINNRNRFPIIQCTPMFQCPEMLDDNIDELAVLRNAPKIDIWSSGITLYQLTTGLLPFNGQTVHQIFENIRTCSHIDIPAFIDKNLNELLTNILNRDPVQRWSLKQIKDSEWFRKKHPVVKDELAPLPQDVIQNELQSFRMIDYLEKLCQQEQQFDNRNSNTLLDTTANNFNGTNVSNSFLNDPNVQNEVLNSNEQTVTAETVNYIQTNGTKSPKEFEQLTKTFKPAKYKRVHCSIM